MWIGLCLYPSFGYFSVAISKKPCCPLVSNSGSDEFFMESNISIYFKMWSH